MTAGDLREVVELQVLVPGEADEYGNVLPDTWTTMVTTPARIRILKGGETVIAGRLAGTQTAVITVRHQPAMAAVTAAYRARNARSGAIYNIRSVTPDERGTFVDLLGESGVAT